MLIHFRMHFVLAQLKSGQGLTIRYALYHGLALAADLISLAATAVFTLSLADIGLDPLGLASGGFCSSGGFSCLAPNTPLLTGCGLATCAVLAAKAIVNTKCLLFRWVKSTLTS